MEADEVARRGRFDDVASLSSSSSSFSSQRSSVTFSGIWAISSSASRRIASRRSSLSARARALLVARIHERDLTTPSAAQAIGNRSNFPPSFAQVADPHALAGRLSERIATLAFRSMTMAANGKTMLPAKVATRLIFWRER